MILSDEQRRILAKRIVSAINKARWTPAEAKDPDAMTERILRFPLSPDTHNSGRMTVDDLQRAREIVGKDPPSREFIIPKVHADDLARREKVQE